jgi:pimeloyl-ACP methyl ester carboxylesterase
MSTITVKDGTTIYYKDWGSSPVVTFSHGWPLNSDAWNAQLHFLAENGFRVIAHNRRGHGRSSQAWSGNDMNGYADDLAAVIETLDLKDVSLVAERMIDIFATNVFGPSLLAREALPHLRETKGSIMNIEHLWLQSSCCPFPLWSEQGCS